MTITTVDESQRKAAKVAGFTYLFTLPFVVFANFAIHDRLLVPGNAAETPRISWRTSDYFVSVSPAIWFTAPAL